MRILPRRAGSRAAAIAVPFCQSRKDSQAILTTRDMPFRPTLKKEAPSPSGRKKDEEGFVVAPLPPCFLYEPFICYSSLHGAFAVAAAVPHLSIYLSIYPPAFGAKCYRAINGRGRGLGRTLPGPRPSACSHSRSRALLPPSHSLQSPFFLTLTHSAGNGSHTLFMVHIYLGHFALRLPSIL